jgi:hypothetical protein
MSSGSAEILDRSLDAWFRGDAELSKELVKDAFELEKGLADDANDWEYSIGLACAASIAIQRGELDSAKNILTAALMLYPDPNLKVDLYTLVACANIQGEAVIGVTGNKPYDEQALKRDISLKGGCIGDKQIWQDDQIVVIGREGFDKDYLTSSVEIGCRYGFTCQYMSQEDFLVYCKECVLPDYYKGDPRMRDHAGLRFLSSIGFEWPSLEAVSDGGGTGNLALQTSHPLRSVYRYSVAQGISLPQRRNALKWAVRKTELGLEVVANHIAGQIRLKKLQQSDRFERAIACWEADLDWLRREYYEGSPYSFVWPEDF